MLPQVLRVLDNSFVAQQPSLWQPVILQLLDKSLIVGHSHPVALTAISTLKQHTSSLLSGILSFLDCSYTLLTRTLHMQNHSDSIKLRVAPHLNSQAQLLCALNTMSGL